jgi:predicted ATPase
VRFALQDFLAEQSRRIWIGETNQLSALSGIRAGQKADLSRGFLREDYSNLNGIVNSIQGNFEDKQKLDESVARVNPYFKGIHIDVDANMIYLSMYESDIKNAMPATRLSDGTLSLVCLLATLLQPNLPPVICLEEPEIGLHPGVIHVVAELLHEASQRTQVIVTTHSDILVDAIGRLSPGAIMICERDQEGTHILRPDPEKLGAWMEKYSLGELWLSGELGGTP